MEETIRDHSGGGPCDIRRSQGRFFTFDFPFKSSTFQIKVLLKIVVHFQPSELDHLSLLDRGSPQLRL